MKYDVIIIGAGPAGLFTAYELITKNKNLKVALLDKGSKVANRFCPMTKNKTKCLNCNPCRILSGYGGAGTFSDGINGDLTFFLPLSYPSSQIKCTVKNINRGEKGFTCKVQK